MWRWDERTVLSLISFAILTCPYSLFVLNVEHFVASSSKWIHPSMSGVWNKSRTVTVPKLQKATKARTGPFLLATKKIDERHLACAGSILSNVSFWFIFCFSIFFPLCRSCYGDVWVGWLSVFSISLLCWTALINPRSLFHMLSTCVCMLLNLSRYAEYWSGGVRSLWQSVLEFLFDYST